MEKLLELLNQHRIELCKWNTTNLIRFKYLPHTFVLSDFWAQHSELLIISKQYWFIKWLVDNDKIDLDKTWYKKADFQEVWNWDWRTVRWYEMLLMLLAIKDKPIDFLISVLR